ncbi:MAG TPA: apolipoprotein N-acyltransferase [Oligoflexia bacterium]|nr:apolipoprotein N-acyltransferase [Oligoflexia bacterium]HMR25580.1 apolipoprotein N-acyltransferase [Oligoflexia bacterium]
MKLNLAKTPATYLIYAVCILLWVFSFPVALGGRLISPPWLNAVCVFFYFLFFLASLENKAPKTAFKIAFTLAFSAYYFILNWIRISMHDHAGMPLWQAQIALIMAASLVALYPALAAAAFAYGSFFLKSQRQRLLLGVLCFSAMELARQITPFSGFPWLMPAYGLHALLSICQVSSIIGVLGLSVCLYLVQFLLYQSLKYKTLTSSFVALIVTGLLWVFGQHQIHYIQQLDTKTINMAWIQGNIPQSLKWTAQGKAMAMDIYNSLSKEHVNKGAEIIVWPEAAVTMLYDQSSSKNKFNADYLNTSYLLFGAPSFIHREHERYYQNSVFAVNQENTLLTRSDKFHLVPFGEYIPFPFSFIEKLVPAAAGSFISGSEQSMIKLPQATFGTLICYESLFGYLSRNMVAQGADILINLTNDAWFNKSSGPYQHKVFAQFRAIETRRSLVRAANTGISTWFDASGIQQQSIALFERGSLQASIPVYTSRSFYVRFPYLVSSIIIFASLILLLNIQKARKDEL